MDNRRLLIRLIALIAPVLIIWFVVDELTSDDTPMPGLSAFIAIGVTFLTALLVWNRTMRVQLLTSALLCAVVVVLFRVIISNDPVRHLHRELRGRWRSIPDPARGSGIITLEFLNDHEVDIRISNISRCHYEVTPREELVITDHLNTTTFEVLDLHDDTLHLKMEFGRMRFVRE